MYLNNMVILGHHSRITHQEHLPSRRTPVACQTRGTASLHIPWIPATILPLLPHTTTTDTHSITVDNNLMLHISILSFLLVHPTRRIRATPKRMALSALITILSTNATNTLLRSLTMDHTILLLIKARIGMVPKPIQHRIHPLAEEDTLATSEEVSYDTFLCLFVDQSLQNTSMKLKGDDAVKV
jgi:hypothetical protein